MINGYKTKILASFDTKEVLNTSSAMENIVAKYVKDLLFYEKIVNSLG